MNLLVWCSVAADTAVGMMGATCLHSLKAPTEHELVISSRIEFFCSFDGMDHSWCLDDFSHAH